ncbi:hypothetical protein AVEN_1244-1 [Araneus ventricosus]|uniref:Uncharacterized protein n=1 Tax=Araneus ventricosus TaxID=182803 RepID=A0A4Y2UYZ2_ARAVE|nr:hypothetical protein AVEN_1244-1 [Araneus ventricosus]
MKNLLIVIGFCVTEGSNFFSHAEGGETAPFWGSIREILGETTPAGSDTETYKTLTFTKIAKSNFLTIAEWPRWPSGKVSALGLEGCRCETRFHCRSVVFRGLLHVKSYVGGRMSSRLCGAEVWREGASSGVVLVNLSQTSPRVASKRDVNIT